MLFSIQVVLKWFFVAISAKTAKECLMKDNSVTLVTIK